MVHGGGVPPGPHARPGSLEFLPANDSRTIPTSARPPPAAKAYVVSGPSSKRGDESPAVARAVTAVDGARSNGLPGPATRTWVGPALVVPPTHRSTWLSSASVPSAPAAA